MWYKKLFVLTVLSMGLFLFFGCSSDEEGPVKPTEEAPPPPDFELREITIPDKMVKSGDAKAQLAISLIDQATSFEGTGCVFAAPEGATVLAESKAAWEYSWVEGALTKRLAITSLSSINQRKWQLYFTGSKDGATFEDWRFMDAGQTNDLSSGHVYVYKTNTRQIMLEWTWRTNQGQYTLEQYDHSDPRLKMEIILRADGSGKVERFALSSSGSLMHDLLVNWSSDGSGTWWTYENGMTKETGAWN